MKYKTEIKNGIKIFLGITGYFLFIEAFGLSEYFLLRIFNTIFVVYGVNKAIKTNHFNGITGYYANVLSAIITSMIGAFLSIFSLYIYIQYNGGETFLKNLSHGFIFGGGELSVSQFCFGLFFESIAASLMVTFCLMQY
jgi:hypothetical protein